MICPICNSLNEMAYSSMSNGFVCLNSDCGFEIEMDPQEALATQECTATVEELVCV